VLAKMKARLRNQVVFSIAIDRSGSYNWFISHTQRMERPNSQHQIS